MKRTSTEAHVYMRRHQGAKVEHFDVSNVIYHIFSHGAVSYMLNGENVNVMLELTVYHKHAITSVISMHHYHEITIHAGSKRGPQL